MSGRGLTRTPPHDERVAQQKITGANAGGPRRLPIWTRQAAHVAQFRRSPQARRMLKTNRAVYLFGLVKIADHRAEDVPAIQVLRGERVVRRFSLNQISNLPVDAENSHLLNLK
jgi:hypothetical protein